MARDRRAILVAGGAHIDVIADYPARADRMLDKVGTVRFSVGGTAYNIAVNLGQAGVPVRLLSAARRGTFASIWIRERLVSAGVDLDQFLIDDRVADSGFVAIRRDGELRSAVTASSVTSILLSSDQLDIALAGSKLVVIDCNFASDQIDRIVKAAQARSLPVVIAVVSDSKVSRLRELTMDQPADLVAMNHLEFAVLFGSFSAGLAHDRIRECCRDAHARRLLVTRAEEGTAFLSEDGSLECFPAPEVEEIVSVTGAGDALLAALIACWAETGELDPRRSQNRMASAVRRALGEAGATSGSLAGDADFAALARLAQSEVSVWQRLRAPEFLIATVVAVLSLLAAVAQLWFVMPTASAAVRPESARMPPTSVSAVERR